MIIIKLTLETNTKAKYFMKNIIPYVTGIPFPGVLSDAEVKAFFREAKNPDISNIVVMHELNNEKVPAIISDYGETVLDGDTVKLRNSPNTTMVDGDNSFANSIDIEFSRILTPQEIVELDFRIRKYCSSVGIKILDIKLDMGW